MYNVCWKCWLFHTKTVFHIYRYDISACHFSPYYYSKHSKDMKKEALKYFGRHLKWIRIHWNSDNRFSIRCIYINIISESNICCGLLVSFERNVKKSAERKRKMKDCKKSKLQSSKRIPFGHFMFE